MQSISLINLALAFIPVLIVIVIIWRWNIGYKASIFAIFRMIVQLLLIGYVLSYIFSLNSYSAVITMLIIMLIAASWISLRTSSLPRKTLILNAFFSIVIGGVTVLIIMTQGVLLIDPWYSPNIMIPLAGMIFANCMNGISLATDRLESELKQGKVYKEAKVVALRTSLIPITNMLLAVGIVSLPGMMTGQILSGVSPMIAVRYQIMVMCMLFGSTGISVAVFLHFYYTKKTTTYK
ncbi:ABC transporter permease [Candidatus Thioglobus sp.]|nr:ABC transporter permease [Candidatus Thioglobus sp.]